MSPVLVQGNGHVVVNNFYVGHGSNSGHIMDAAMGQYAQHLYAQRMYPGEHGGYQHAHQLQHEAGRYVPPDTIPRPPLGPQGGHQTINMLNIYRRPEHTATAIQNGPWQQPYERQVQTQQLIEDRQIEVVDGTDDHSFQRVATVEPTPATSPDLGPQNPVSPIPAQAAKRQSPTQAFHDPMDNRHQFGGGSRSEGPWQDPRGNPSKRLRLEDSSHRNGYVSGNPRLVQGSKASHASRVMSLTNDIKRTCVGARAKQKKPKTFADLYIIFQCIFLDLTMPVHDESDGAIALFDMRTPHIRDEVLRAKEAGKVIVCYNDALLNTKYDSVEGLTEELLSMAITAKAESDLEEMEVQVFDARLAFEQRSLRSSRKRKEKELLCMHTWMKWSELQSEIRNGVEGLNALDLYVEELENYIPWFLEGDDELLRRIEISLMEKGKGKESERQEDQGRPQGVLNRAGKMTRWALRASRGVHTLPHEDESGVATWLHQVKGTSLLHFLDATVRGEAMEKWDEAAGGIGWNDRDFKAYCEGFKNGDQMWRTVILEPGTTAFFRGGTPHAVSRAYDEGADTFVVGGHILLPTEAAFKTCRDRRRAQDENHSLSNEELKPNFLKVAKQVLRKEKPECWGLTEDEIERMVTVCDSDVKPRKRS